MENQIDLYFLKGILRRRKIILIGSFSLVFIIALLVAFLLPPIYQSQVGIIIEEQQIPENYVQSTITSYVEERIEMITQQVMSRTKLLEIISKHKLYLNLKEDKTTSEILSEMRNSIELETLTADVGHKNSVTIGFRLLYSGRNPEKLQAVANELAYLYIEEEHRVKEKQASVTTDFLQQELNNFKEHIEYLENKIGEFKKENSGALPQNYASNLQVMNRLVGQLDRIEPSIRSSEERKFYLKTQLANIEPMTPIMMDGKNVMMNPAERLKRLRLQFIGLRSSYSDKHPDIIKIQNEIKELESQVGRHDDSVLKIKLLKDLSGKLAVARGRLGDRHPDVIKLTKEYNTLSKEVDRLITIQATIEVQDAKPDNPLYINLMAQIFTIDSQIKGRAEEKQKITKEIEKYQKLIENAPLIEAEYNDLTRGREMAMKKYNDLLGKLLQSQIAQGMEVSQRGERFTISEPASYPDRPVKPNRKLIIVLGLLLGIGVGAGLAAVLEAMDESFKSINEIASITGLPVFSSFPLIQTEDEKKKKRRKNVIYFLLFIGVAVGVVVIFNYIVMPLDVLWAKVINRLIILGVPLDGLIGGKS
jgi:protein tyrosine kinase modulator